MGFLGKAERVVYWAKNLTTGLLNVKAYVVRPDLTYVGPFSMVEMVPLVFKGVYYFDFISTTSDPEGEYTVIIVSPSENIRTPYKVRLDQPFPTQPSDLVFKNLFKTDVVGVVDDVRSELVGVIQVSDLVAEVQDANGNLIGQILSEGLVASVNDSDAGLVGAVQDADSVSGAL